MEFRDAIELGILPDPDSDPIYSYKYELKDKESNTLVGYLSINGWINQEMGVKIQITTRYTVDGQLAAVSVR